KIPVLRAERITDPRTERRPAGKDLAGVEHHQRLGMVVVFGLHRTHHAKLIGYRAEVRYHLAHFHAALAASMKREWRAEELVRLAPFLEHLHFFGVLFPVEFFQ